MSSCARVKVVRSRRCLRGVSTRKKKKKTIYIIIIIVIIIIVIITIIDDDINNTMLLLLRCYLKHPAMGQRYQKAHICKDHVSSNI